MTPWLFIIGLGEDGLAGLSAAARALIESAQVLVGGARHLAKVPEDGRERLTWTRPLSDLIEEIAARRGQAVCVLATGDPLDYGIGVTLARRIPAAETIVVPAPSAFSLACARLGWPRAAIECVTLHGRPLELLHPAIQPEARILALSNDVDTPAKVAALLTARGYGASRLTVLEHMGGPKERLVEGLAREWGETGIADFNTLAIACAAGPDAALLPRMPGLPDEAFHHDGQMTKREVRAVTVAALAPAPGQHLWDIGAGCGSVAIEWMRSHPRNRASAVERQADRVALMAGNAAALGVPSLDIRHGQAPEALDNLDPPDAVFLGGGLSTPGLIDTLWGALKPGGRLVANAVTLEGEQVLAGFHTRNGDELIRIAISRTHPIGPYTGWRTFMPVTQVRAIKS